MKYFKKLAGEKVYLSPIDPDDAEKYTEWLNNPEILQFITLEPQVIGVAGERAMLEKMAASGHNFAVVRQDDDELLGTVSLNFVDMIFRRAELGIFLGEPAELSKGYGAEAIKLLLDYGFNTLGLHSIELFAFAFNERALACYRKVGFRECGRLSEAAFKRGQYHDMVIMQMLDREFNANNEK
jgi:Acetyltransferases, including N-acetylases of ribosomal proteins